MKFASELTDSSTLYLIDGWAQMYRNQSLFKGPSLAYVLGMRDEIASYPQQDISDIIKCVVTQINEYSEQLELNGLLH